MSAAKIALEALENIALAGMSPSPEMSGEAVTDWHARQAWNFISIAARALEPLRAAIKAEAVHPAGANKLALDKLKAVYNLPWNADNLPQLDAAIFSAIKALEAVQVEPVSQHPDDIAVDAFAVAMKIKLAEKRTEGRSGWQDLSWKASEISWQIRSHVDKGDPVDVANYCMFLSARAERITPFSTPEIDRLRVCNLELVNALQDVLTNHIANHNHMTHAKARAVIMKAMA